ncbi:retrovirus-related pol polyprotein [Lentinula edodes]|uniref:Retrovirus-related pol polyprotein n=1 Tax=Lentinula edodes TaxID=5353 RepID=A0A1Q3E5G9_LENED|nr:retrovirus-related pol polyprotein [Lentinula edodes]
MKRHAFDAEVETETVVLRRTNVDLWGPARVRSVGGARYSMLFDDAASARQKSFFLENRLALTILEALKFYKLQAEAITGMRMVFLRTDNAPKFWSNIVQDWLKSVGITFIPGPPYSSSANGTVERGIGHKTSMVRVMMLDARLGAKWWAEAWQAADRTNNLLPSTRIPGKIPEVVFTGKKQDAGFLRVWGCVAYVHVPKEWSQDKVEPRGIKGRLIGYDMESHGTYRILIPETSGIIRSRDVHFEEGSGHRTLTAEGEYFIDGDSEDKNYDFLDIKATDSDAIKAVPDPDPANTENTNITPKVRRTRGPRKDYSPPTCRSARVAERETQDIPEVEKNPNLADLSDLTDLDEEDPDPTALTATPITSIAEPDNKFIPKLYEEAMDPIRKHLWMGPMEKEMMKWVSRGVVEPVVRQKEMKPIKNMWVYDLKEDSDGRLLERRARCVVKGMESIQMLLALTASLNLHLFAFDFTGAYLNAKPQGKNYLEIPKGFENYFSIDDMDTVLDMLYNIYGTMDGGNNWFWELDGTISIHQQLLIKELVEQQGMTGSRPKYTPLPPNLNLIDSQPLPIPPDDSHFMADKDYRHAVGTMGYIANGTRPDISFAVNFLMRFATDPRPIHWRLVQHCISYLDTTKERMIIYRRDATIKPEGYSDGSFADDPKTRKSTYGYVFTMAGGPVAWKSKPQNRVGTSTAEVEYVAMSESGKQAM